MSNSVLTVRLNIGQGEKFTTTKEAIEFFGDSVRAAAVYDVFDQRDQMRELLMILSEYIQSAAPDGSYWTDTLAKQVDDLVYGKKGTE